jgi:hypothetical protein
MLKRRQWFELEDQAWLPAVLRDGVTDFLQFAVNRGDLYASLAPKLADAVTRARAVQVVDLCSGGGGPWEQLLGAEPAIVRQGGLLLTDFFPNDRAARALKGRFPGRVDHVPTSVSALDVPPELVGFRTLFSSFHHFEPAQARSILQDAVDKGQGIAIAESTQRHPLMLLYMLLTPLLVWFATPFYGSYSWKRLFWTYPVPLIPLIVMFDGLVSCMRTYTPEELAAMISKTPGHDRFEWEVGILKIGPLPVGTTFLLGVPRAHPTAA